MKHFQALSQLAASGRAPETPLVRRGDGSTVLDWQDFCRQVELLGAWLAQRPEPAWLLHAHRTGHFLVGALAVLQAGRELVLPGSLMPGLLAAIRAERSAGLGLLADEEHPEALDLRGLAAAAAGAATEHFPAWQSDRACRPFPPIDPQAARITLYTSGSTGQPKAVPKRLAQVEAELANLAALWGSSMDGTTVWSTVSQQHFYGLLFQAFLPLCLGLPIGEERIHQPEGFLALGEQAVSVVCSPAFLKRLVDNGPAPRPFAYRPWLFSSGGVLPDPVAAGVRELTGASIHEIYGSTETGGVAWREAPGGVPWRPFRGHQLRIGAGDLIEIKSDYLPDGDYYASGDRGSLDAAGMLTLLGRTDTIVKIEEKRVALNEVENRLCESGLVAEAAVLALEHGRQFLGAVVVPSAEGRERFAGLGKHERNNLLRDWLHRWFEPTVLPRKWRFVDELPRNTQGKRDRQALEALFAAEAPRPVEPAILRIEQGPGRLVLDHAWPADALWFQGHFDAFPILPGVVQIDWVMQCARRYLGVDRALRRLPRLKFQQPIRPGMPVSLELEWDPAKAQLSFRYLELAGGNPLASGKINLEPL